MRIEYFKSGEIHRAPEDAAAAAAAGFGGSVRGLGAALSADGPSSIQLHAVARAQRARDVGDIVAGGMHAAAARFRHFIAEWRRRGEVRATARALCELDSRTLRDLGIDRSEVLSVALGVERVRRTEDARQGVDRTNHYLRLF